MLAVIINDNTALDQSVENELGDSIVRVVSLVGRKIHGVYDFTPVDLRAGNTQVVCQPDNKIFPSLLKRVHGGTLKNHPLVNAFMPRVLDRLIPCAWM